MRFKFSILLALLVLLVAIYFSWFLIGSGLQIWAAWESRHQGIRIELGKIHAPLLRPVLIDRVKITDPSTNFIEVEADHVSLSLNLMRMIGARGRSLRQVQAEHLRIRATRPEIDNPKTRFDWSVVQKLLPGSFNTANLELRVEAGDTVILLHGGAISGSEIEAGRFSANELMISSPLLHQTFSHLRGATKWQDNRLTFGGITLGGGLDLQTLTIDMSRLAKERVDFQFDLDTFGGKMRASFSDEWRPGHALWNFAGSGSDISLAQTSQAVGFTDQIGGSLHACKFTFRGDPRDLTHATASIWTELTGLSWREHQADTIMIGAVFYDRHVQLQQLYVKQRNNQLTLSGEGSLGSKPNEWFSPDFRGNVSGSIKDLGQFASLFGAQTGDFAGEVEVQGTVDTRDRNIGGHITASGNGLSIFSKRIDEFVANFGFKGPELEVEQFDLSRTHDWLHAEGALDLGGMHNYSGSISADVANLTDYLSIFGLTTTPDSHPTPAHLQFAIDAGVWNGNLTITTNDSRPVSLGLISLPLWFGEGWNEISIRPLNAILSFPLLSLDNGPRWLGLGVLRGGMISGGIHLSGTLRNPVLDGDIQLVNGKMDPGVLGFSGMSGHVTFSQSHGSIEFLRLANDAVDLSMTGEIDATAADRIAIGLASNLPLLNLTSQSVDCATRITFSPTDTMFGQPLSQLEFDGGFGRPNWTITLRGTPAKLLAPSRTEDRTLPFCQGASLTGNELKVGVYSPPQQAAAHRRKRNRAR